MLFYEISYLRVAQSSIGTWSTDSDTLNSTARVHTSGAAAAEQSCVMTPGKCGHQRPAAQGSPSSCTAALPGSAAAIRIRPGCWVRLLSDHKGNFQNIDYFSLKLGVIHIFNNFQVCDLSSS